MPVIPKEPLEWLTLFRQRINVLFEHLSAIEQQEGSQDHSCNPPVDIYETADAFVIEIDLPGFARQDLSLSICCSTLVIEGTKHKGSGDTTVNYICLERSFGRFCKTIEIPPAVDVGKVAARYDKGVLAVTFPRLPETSIIREIPIA